MHLKLEDIANSFGTVASDFTDDFVKLYKSTDWSYEAVIGNDRDKLIIDLFEFLKKDSKKSGGIGSTIRWSNGWKENLDMYIKSNNIKDIIPKFIRSNQPIRYKKEFIFPRDPNFELNYIRLIQKWMFHKYMSVCSSIHEFGCGSGIHLIALSDMYPEKDLCGYDYVQPSIDLINTLSETINPKLKGFLFNMLSPLDISIDKDSCIFTFCAIEQLASKFHNFLEFILRKKPKICIHIEPTIELYDSTNLIDYTAVCFHKHRGYTVGLLPHLQELHKQQKIELMKVHRMQFGSIRMEGYTQIIWRPI